MQENAALPAGCQPEARAEPLAREVGKARLERRRK